MMKRVVLAGVIGLTLAATAMPTKQQLKSVQGLVAELMAGDIQACKAGKKTPSAVAAAAEGYARDAETEAAKFLFLKGAFGYYVQDGAYDEALRVLNQLTESVKDVPDKVMAEIVVAKLKKLSKKQATGIFEYYERLERRMSMGEERAKLEKALKENPTSKEAQHDLAVCLAVLGNWPAALEHFAKAGGKESEAASAEKAKKTAEAANLWWEAAQGDATDALQAHAASLYRQAIADGKLSGLKLTLAKKRIAEVAPESGESRAPVPVPSGKSRSVADATERVPPVVAAERVPAAPKGKYDWSIPDDPKVMKKLDLDLGNGEKMTFFAMPPGRCSAVVGASASRILVPKGYRMTHPFWISRIPVTIGQYEAFGANITACEILKLGDIFKGEHDIAVLAAVTRPKVVSFLSDMNARFGATLPKGWVFRVATLAERSLALDRRRAYMFDANPQAAAEQLKAFQKKGYLLSCKDLSRDGEEAFKEMGLLPWSKRYVVTLGEPCMTRGAIGLSLFGPTLDRIATPEMTSALPPWKPEVIKACHLALERGMKDVDPFWYCDEGALGARSLGPMGVGPLLSLKREPDDIYSSHSFTVAVGYDYVGEWKREHGK